MRKRPDGTYGPDVVELTDLDDSDAECGQPCHPAHPCDECADYWQRMIGEGYWDDRRHRWTDKGWREITKWP